MEANLPAKPASPYPNWGPGAAVIGVLLALGAGIVLGVPALIIDNPANGQLSTGANVAVQLATAIGFVLVPIALAIRWGASSVAGALRRLGVRGFRPSALVWMLAVVGAYLLFGAAYTTIFGAPHQEDIAKGFGAVPVQVLLIVVAAPISEEICFRGMLFGGFRQRFPPAGAALASGAVFGILHVITGISAVPPLTFLGFLLALLYDKTGSIVPGILLHMLNNSVALLAK